MGVELVLSLRLPPLNGASSFSVPFSVRKLLPEHGLNSPRRRWCVVASEAQNSGLSSNPEGNSEYRFHTSLDNYHSHHQQQHLHHHQHHQFHHHHQLPRPWQGCLDAGWHSRQFESVFSTAAESDSGYIEKPELGPCTSSVSHNANCPSSIKRHQISVDHAGGGGFISAGVDLPLSLRMLKRKQQDFGRSPLASGLSEVGNALLNAFSSVVYMIKTLQSHTLHIRQQFFEQEIEGLLSQVQREMHVSFLWLFQQVFSCTPELMVLVMVLLADFTAFSMANNMPLLPISMYNAPVSIASMLSNNIKSSDESLRAYVNKSFKASPSIVDKGDGIHHDGGFFGNGGRRINHHTTGGDDGCPDPYDNLINLNKALYAVDDNLPTELSSKAGASTVSLHGYLPRQINLPPNDFSASIENSMASDFSEMAAALAFEELTTSEDLYSSEALLPASSNDVVDYVQAAKKKGNYRNF